MTDDFLSRRHWLRAGTASMATAALAAGQQTPNTLKAEGDHSISNPGPKNKVLFDDNPNSNVPPPTDHGDFGPIWYSFDLTHKKLQ